MSKKPLQFPMWFSDQSLISQSEIKQLGIAHHPFNCNLFNRSIKYKIPTLKLKIVNRRTDELEYLKSVGIIKCPIPRSGRSSVVDFLPQYKESITSHYISQGYDGLLERNKSILCILHTVPIEIIDITAENFIYLEYLLTRLLPFKDKFIQYTHAINNDDVCKEKVEKLIKILY
jgi:hypothetical protein